MGEIADMMLEGILCEGCGEPVDGRAPGYPRRCRGCAPKINLMDALKLSLSPAAKRSNQNNRERRAAALTRKPFECRDCGKPFRTEQGRAQHQRDVHS